MMAFDMDELNRRRQQRAQQRQQRQQEQRRLLIRLAIAGVVLIASAGLILAIALGGGDQPEQTDTQTVIQTDTHAQQPTDTTAPDATTVIHFAAAGDLNITDRVVASGGSGYDYTQAFMDVVPLLSQADVTAVNFEGVVSGVTYGGERAAAPQQMLTALKNAGVDLLQTANSKILNDGVAGLVSTVQSIRGAGFESVGAFESKADFDRTGGYTVLEVRGVKIAVVAFTKGMDGLSLPAGSESCVNLLYEDYSSYYQKVNTQGITRVLRKAAEEKPDVTIALLHWGSEYKDSRSDTQADICKLMIAEGVDAIIGTHPHYVQEMGFDEATGAFVAYSLGDFFSDATRSGTEYSVVLDLEITKDNLTGQTAITNYSYTPIFTAEDTAGNLRVLRLEPAMAAYEAGNIERVSEQTYDSMVYALKRIQERVNPEETE